MSKPPFPKKNPLAESMQSNQSFDLVSLIKSEKLEDTENIDITKVKIDKQTFKRWEKDAKKGNKDAQHLLALCYEHGNGIDKNLTKAFKWYQEAAIQGVVEAQNNLASCHKEGKGTVQNYAEAFKWYQKAVAQGLAEAQYNLAACYQQGNGVDKDLSKAFEWCQKAAIQGLTEAQYNLAQCYEYGKGVNKDLTKAFEWYQKAAIQGDAEAQFNLAQCYRLGDGVDKNLIKAFEWYQKAALQGDVEAQFNLALCFHYGNGVDKDLTKAFEWYQKAADQDNAEARYNLAVCYQIGEVVPQNFQKAIELYEGIIKNAEEEHLKILAHFALSKIYKDTSFKSADLEKAKFHLKEITEDKEINPSYLEGIDGISEENQEQVVRVIQKVAQEELIDLERHEAKEQANIEMLSFLTHTLNNSLGSVKEGVNLIIKELGTDYETDPHKFKAVSRMLALENSFSVIGNLVQTFKQVLNEPAKYQESWQQDTQGDSNIKQVVMLSLQQTISRLFFEHSNLYLTKFFPTLSRNDCSKLRQQFIQDIIINNENCFNWLETHFNMISWENTADNIHFSRNGKRFTFFFSIISELLYNAIRYAIDKPIKLSWIKEGNFYTFTCINSFDPDTRHEDKGSEKGLIFIKRLLTLLKDCELIPDENEQDNLFTVTLKLHEENFV